MIHSYSSANIIWWIIKITKITVFQRDWISVNLLVMVLLKNEGKFNTKCVLDWKKIKVDTNENVFSLEFSFFEFSDFGYMWIFCTLQKWSINKNLFSKESVFSIKTFWQKDFDYDIIWMEVSLCKENFNSLNWYINRISKRENNISSNTAEISLQHIRRTICQSAEGW